MLITGGSRGIGAAVARRAARAGYDVAISFNSNRHAADSVITEIEALGRRAIAVRCDVASESDVVGFFDQTVESLGSLDAVIVNAGILFERCRVEDLTVAR